MRLKSENNCVESWNEDENAESGERVIGRILRIQIVYSWECIVNRAFNWLLAQLTRVFNSPHTTPLSPSPTVLAVVDIPRPHRQRRRRAIASRSANVGADDPISLLTSLAFHPSSIFGHPLSSFGHPFSFPHFISFRFVSFFDHCRVKCCSSLSR